MQLRTFVWFVGLIWLAQGLRVSRHHFDPAALEARFESGVKKCIQQNGFDINKPIVVTAFDDWYQTTAKKWVARNRELGVNQYLMIAMEHRSAELARHNGFPALNANGECLESEENAVSSDMGRWVLPDSLSFVKFLVPALLMQEGYKRVVFSEMDVFFFENPFDATGNIQKGHALAMRNPWPTSASTDVNIGFVEFHPDEQGQLIAMILRFARKMAWSADEMSKVGGDQVWFNSYVKKKEFSFFHLTLLDPPYFAVKGGLRTNVTKVVHFAFATPKCKMERLNQLYDNPNSPVADQPGTPKKGEPVWMEC